MPLRLTSREPSRGEVTAALGRHPAGRDAWTSSWSVSLVLIDRGARSDTAPAWPARRPQRVSEPEVCEVCVNGHRNAVFAAWPPRFNAADRLSARRAHECRPAGEQPRTARSTARASASRLDLARRLLGGSHLRPAGAESSNGQEDLYAKDLASADAFGGCGDGGTDSCRCGRGIGGRSAHRDHGRECDIHGQEVRQEVLEVLRADLRQTVCVSGAGLARPARRGCRV